MNGRNEQLKRFERLLQQSSLGRPGARQLSERTSDADVKRTLDAVTVGASHDAVASGRAADVHDPVATWASDRIVGRDKELRTILGALGDTTAGTGGCFIVSGPSGIGKSRLLRAAVGLAGERAVPVAARQAHQHDLGAPLATLGQALLACIPPSDAFAWLSRPRLQSVDEEAGIHQVKESLEQHAARRPLLIVLDDVQWMDELSALTIRELVPALAASPVRWLLAGNQPIPEVAGSQTLQWLIDRGARPVELAALDDHAVALLCSALLNADPDDSVLEVVATCDGDPSRVEQLIWSLRLNNRIEVIAGVATLVSGQSPEPLADALASAESSASTDLERSGWHLLGARPVDRLWERGWTAPDGLGWDPPTAQNARTGGSHEEASGSSPTVLRILLGVQLRRLREARAITREDAGWEIRASGSKISRIELGRVSLKERDVADLLTFYGVSNSNEQEALLGLARQADDPGWWQQFSDALPSWFQSYLGLEAAATLIRTYEIQFVPGLLQTPEYARAVIMLGRTGVTADEMDRRIGLRRQRQRILHRPAAPQLWAIIDEAVLRRPIGGVHVMREQIEFLIEAAKKPNVRLQIIPFNAVDRAPVGNPFAILRFPEPELPDVVYVEALTSAIYIDRREDVERYARALERVCIDAEPPNHTLEILGKILYEVGHAY